jgi:hypothetical protein
MTVEIEMEMRTQKIEPKVRVCPICKKEMGFTLAAGLISPEWTHGNRVLYYLWARWTKYIRRIPLNIQCHVECTPTGYRQWTVVMEPDLVVLYDPDAEEELIKLIAEQVDGEVQ